MKAESRAIRAAPAYSGLLRPHAEIPPFPDAETRSGVTASVTIGVTSSATAVTESCLVRPSHAWSRLVTAKQEKKFPPRARMGRFRFPQSCVCGRIPSCELTFPA